MYIFNLIKKCQNTLWHAFLNFISQPDSAWWSLFRATSFDIVHINDFVNADVIAQGLSAFHPEKVSIPAGRIMLKRIHTLAEENINFAFETTLASRTFFNWIKQLKEKKKL